MLSLVDDVNHDSETASHNSSVEMFSSSCSLPEASVWCKLCFSDNPTEDMHKLYDCRCIFCLKCMKQYLNILISEGNITPLTCPDAQCEEQGKILPKELEIILDKDMYGRYTRLKLAKEVELDPHRTWCPQAGCETVCTICIDDVSQRSSVKCPSCALIFCSFCKATWHQSRSCDEIMKKKAKKDQGIPFNCNEDAIIKRCPLCHVPIERDDGCAQMMCKRCKHVFCWYCLASLDDDFLLRHYDKGPCKNKLGHSRASVIWHRTQVIGIFAGFGVLLLVASPFLLLAAPCILCCKCKVCNGCEEEEDLGTI